MATITDAGKLKVPPTFQVTPTPSRRTRRITETNQDADAVFLERKDLKTSKYEYSRDRSNPGLVLIFNQERFEGQDPRIGTRRDVNEIAICFGRLGLNISSDNIHTDYSRQEILNTIDEIINSDQLSQVNSLVVFFLSHGDSLNNLHSSDGTLKANEIWEQFASCKQLEGKPKMFVFQACKGDKHSTIPDQPIPIVGEEKREHELVDFNSFASNYLSPDMLVVYSATEGNLSFRNPVTGTWFIQELCKIFSAYGRRDDVVSLLIRTTKCVSGNYSYYDRKRNQILKQMPLFVSTLRKKFYLNRSKDRHIILHILEEQEKIWRAIRDLEHNTRALMQAKK